MIVVKEFPDKEFTLFKALRENKSTLIAQKKMITKEADSIIGYVEVKTDKTKLLKRILLIQILIRSKLSWLSLLTLDSHLTCI
jgi:hypothetical protein